MRDGAPILIVEDSDDDVFLLERAWKKAGIQVPLVFAADGEEGIHLLQEALATAAEPNKLPKVVLTDLKMPKVSGFEVLEYLKTHCASGSPVALVWSNSSEISDLRRAYALGARCYLPKPRDEQGWRVLIERIMEFYAP